MPLGLVQEKCCQRGKKLEKHIKDIDQCVRFTKSKGKIPEHRQ